MEKKTNLYINEDFKAEFTCGDSIVDSIIISIEYTPDKPHIICGTAKDHALNYLLLVPLMNNQVKRFKLTMKAKSIKNPTKTLSCDNLYLNNLDPLKLYNATLSSKMINSTQRQISYLLIGPQEIWNLDKQPDEKVIFDINCSNYSMELVKFSLNPNILAFIFTSKWEHSRFSDNEFISETTSYVDTITLLASFIGKKRIEWFAYELTSQNGESTFIRQNTRCDNREPNWEYHINKFRALDFLKTSLPVFIRHKQNNFNITNAIRYYLWSKEMKYTEAKFTTLYTGFEYLKTSYVNANELELIEPGEPFKKLSKKIRNVINEYYEDYNTDIDPKIIEKKRSSMKLKIGEINRYPIKHIVKKLCNDYSISIAKLYPAETKPTLFTTRNNLIHETNEIDFNLLYIELCRLTVLMESLIYKILEWDDMTNIEKSVEYSEVEYMKSKS